MKKTLECVCGKDMELIRDTNIEQLGNYVFACECGEKVMTPQNNPEIKTWKRYKIKINQAHATEFEKLLQDMNLDYKITPYTKDLIIWGVSIEKEEDIKTIKSLQYLNSFEEMPIVVLSNL